MEFALQGSTGLSIEIPSNTYRPPVVIKCFYWYGKHFEVDITEHSEHTQVTLTRKEGEMSAEYVTMLKQKVKQDLIDFRTRDIVTQETHSIRELLIAKAFSHSDELDEQPPGEVSDPVGFQP